MLKILLAATVATLIPVMSGPSASMSDEFPLPSAPSASIVQPAPPEFWSPPDRPVLLMFGSPAVVNQVCGATPGYITLACTVDTAVPRTLMPNPCMYQHEYYAKLLCHEMGHVSRQGQPGWRH